MVRQSFNGYRLEQTCARFSAELSDRERVHSVTKRLDVYNIARVVNVECMRVARAMRKG